MKYGELGSSDEVVDKKAFEEGDEDTKVFAIIFAISMNLIKKIFSFQTEKYQRN